MTISYCERPARKAEESTPARSLGDLPEAALDSLAQSEWIGGPGNTFCRTEFLLPGRPRAATLRIVADPHTYAIKHWQKLPTPYPYDNWLVGGSFLKFRAYINGSLSATGPFRAIEDGVAVVHEFDVRDFLTAGANALAVLSRGEARGFALVLEIEDEKGVRWIHSSGEWRQRDANAVYRPICWERPAIEQYAKGGPSPGEYPEHLDGWVYPQGWREAGFDDGCWDLASTYGKAEERYEWPDCRGYEMTRCQPLEIRVLGEGNYLVDFGRPVFGGVELACPAGGGSVELRLSEELLPNGHARYQLRTENCFQEIWRFAPDSEPLFHMGTRMFRYAEVVNWSGSFNDESISVVALGAPFDHSRSALQCSDERLEQVWELCKNTIAHTTADVFTDCLTRERLAYEADTYVTMLTHFSTEGSLGTARRTLDYLIRHPSWPCEWWQMFIPLFHEYLLYSGDYDFVDQHYEFLRDRTSYHSRMSQGLIRDFPRESIVDWPITERDGFVFGEGNAVANAFAHWDLDVLSRLAGFLGRDADAGFLADQAETLCEGFNKELFNEATGLYVDSLNTNHGAFHTNMYALRFGLVPEARRQSVVDFIKGRGMGCSVFGAQFLLEALFKNGEAEAALGLMTSNGRRSWLEMIGHGAVATTESWLSDPKKNMSWAHPWGASPANVIVRHLFGLKPTQPGWRDFTFAPAPGGLDYGALRINTIRGSITASFERTGAEYRHVCSGFDGDRDVVVERDGDQREFQAA